MVTQPTALASQAPRPDFLSGPLGVAVVADHRRCARRAVCQKAQARRLLGTENGSPRATASAGSWRAMRCARLQALGIAEIRMGKGGGARVARGNPRLFAEALAVQLDLTGVSAAEIMDAQRAIECLAAELAAENATDGRHRAAAAVDRRSRGQSSATSRAYTALGARISSRRRRSLAQPRAGGAAHLAAARLVAARAIRR